MNFSVADVRAYQRGSAVSYEFVSMVVDDFIFLSDIKGASLIKSRVKFESSTQSTGRSFVKSLHYYSLLSDETS